jgi:hypothetical protein
MQGLVVLARDTDMVDETQDATRHKRCVDAVQKRHTRLVAAIRTIVKIQSRERGVDFIAHPETGYVNESNVDITQALGACMRRIADPVFETRRVLRDDMAVGTHGRGQHFRVPAGTGRYLQNRHTGTDSNEIQYFSGLSRYVTSFLFRRPRI